MWDLQGHPTGPPQCFAPDTGEGLPSWSQPVPSPSGGDTSAWHAAFGWRPSEEAHDWIYSQCPATRGTSDMPAPTSCTCGLLSHFPALPTLGALPAPKSRLMLQSSSSSFHGQRASATGNPGPPTAHNPCSRRLLGPVPPGLKEGCATSAAGSAAPSRLSRSPFALLNHQPWYTWR